MQKQRTEIEIPMTIRKVIAEPDSLQEDLLWVCDTCGAVPLTRKS